MAAGTKFVVFYAFWPFYRILNAYNSENFRHLHHRIIMKNILFAVGFFALQIAFCGVVFSGTCRSYRDIKNACVNATLLGIIVSSIQIAIAFVSMLCKLTWINAVINRLQSLVTKRCARSPESLVIFEKFERRLEYFAAFSIKYSIFVTVSYYGTTALTPISYLIFQYPDVDHWPRILPTPVSFSNETNVFVQFYVDWIVQVAACTAYYMMAWTLTVFFIGTCLYLSGLKEDLRMVLSAKSRAAQSDYSTGFVGAAVFHNEIIDLAHSVGEIMSVGLFFQLLVCAASLALCMVGIEKSGLSSTNFFLAMAGVVTTVTSTYIYCFLSENVASDLSAIGSIFYDCEWYRLPVKQQKLFGVAIQRAQKSFRMTGLGLVECSLRVFTSIMRAAWSYFIMMQGFK